MEVPEPAPEGPEAPESAVEEAPELTGAVIPAEECQAEGYNAKYGIH